MPPWRLTTSDAVARRRISGSANRKVCHATLPSGACGTVLKAREKSDPDVIFFSVLFEFAEKSKDKLEVLYLLAGVTKGGSSKHRQVKLVKSDELESAKEGLEVSSFHVYRSTGLPRPHPSSACAVILTRSGLPAARPSCPARRAPWRRSTTCSPMTSSTATVLRMFSATGGAPPSTLTPGARF